MDRLEILNYLVEKEDYKSYLNIGVFTGYTLDGVKCGSKIGVDPQSEHYKGSQELFKGTSDEYFIYLDTFHKDKKFGIIFIDGLHKASQVYRDIQNSLRYLSPGGIILLHDMLPPTYQHTTTGDKYGNWNGDCYKALLQFIQNDFLGNYKVRTISTDWGIGIIKPYEGVIAPPERSYSLDYNKAIGDWDYFDKNRNELLNVISVEEFKKIF